MAYIETKTGGWLREQEDFEGLVSQAVPNMSALHMAEEDLPETVDPTSWLKIENQAAQGACAGHSLSSVIEWLNSRVGGNYTQLSRACGYYETQRIDRIRGDRGSTIMGGIKLAKEQGICSEADWPYPSRYNPSRPSSWANSVRYKIAKHELLNDFDSVLRYCQMGLGIHTGMMWGNSMDSQAPSGIIRSFRAGGGGHSVCVIGCRTTDWNGNPLGYPHPILWNSWSKRWGHNGCVLLTREAVTQILAGRWTVFAGCYGAPTPKRISESDFENEMAASA